MRSRRHSAVVVTCAAVFVSGLLLTAFGGTPSPRLAGERVVVLGQSGRIIQTRVGEIVDVQLGDVASSGLTWRFSSSGTAVRAIPVFTAVMPVTRPPDGGGAGRETAGRSVPGLYAAMPVTEAMPGAVPSSAASPQVEVCFLRLTAVRPGVATVKGWQIEAGAAATQPPGLPVFVFVVLVRK